MTDLLIAHEAVTVGVGVHTLSAHILPPTLVFSVQQFEPTVHSSAITGQAIQIDYTLFNYTSIEI